MVYVANLQFKCNSYKKDIHKRYCKNIKTLQETANGYLQSYYAL